MTPAPLAVGPVRPRSLGTRFPRLCASDGRTAAATFRFLHLIAVPARTRCAGQAADRHHA